jgi:hypothetical protein
MIDEIKIWGPGDNIYSTPVSLSPFEIVHKRGTWEREEKENKRNGISKNRTQFPEVFVGSIACLPTPFKPT